jgi:GTP-binding protein HflX
VAVPIRSLIEIHPPTDRAVLVAAPRRSTRDARFAQEHLDELSRLTDTAGARVVGRVKQVVETPSPHTYIGDGKVEQLKQLTESTGANLVVFDEELSPGQGKALETALGLRIMDRSELILDIFASRARTKEAKMQVELAQLEYLLPRLARMWVHLSRIRGGIGLRGPGETQLETDRRMIRRKISQLKKKGYTNAGKSSLLRALTGAETFVEDRLFATLDTLTREASVDGRRRVRLIDTVGFIRKLPHHLVASFRATLEEATGADVLLHVIDAAHSDWEEQVEVVDGVFIDLGLDMTSVLHVFNKMDLMAEPAAFAHRVRSRYEKAVCVSASTGSVSELKQALGALAASSARFA